MAVLTFPEMLIRQVEWKLISNTQTFYSPLTGSAQTLELPGARWAATLTLTVATDAEKRVLSAFFVRLRGAAGRFYVSDPSNSTPAGSVAGAPVVAQSVSNTPTQIGVSGFTADATGVLKAGDMIGFTNDELKMVVEDVDADANGEAIVKVEPPFRSQPPDASAITTTSPTCIMRLVDDEQVAWIARGGKLFDFQPISCVEAIV